MKLKLAQDLINFIDESPSPFHVSCNVKEVLLQNGFLQLDETVKWELQKEGKYFVEKSNSAVVAFVIGNGDLAETGFRVIAAHVDSPTFKIKPISQVLTKGCYITLNIEGYGGVIVSTWFDRPLTFAGKVVLRSNDVLNPIEKLIHVNKPIMVIPNLAIHLNREIHDGYAYNKQKDCLPLVGLMTDTLNSDDYLLDIIAEELKINKEDILDYDLYLTPTEKGEVIGNKNEFISVGKLDDLWMVFAGVNALVNSEETDATKVMICFNNEEVGSQTCEGADSNMVKNILERINYCLENDLETLQQALVKSLMISADLAHALHPNYVEKHDPTNTPVLGKGLVIKYSSSRRYATNSVTASVIKQCCIEAEEPFQTFVNRSDALGGSTVGPIASSNLTIQAVDVGTPILAMHSTRELGTVDDNASVLKVFKKFYEV